MHSICILYATREGQTRRIAEHVAAELRGRGFAVTVTNVRDYTARSNLNACTAAILAASVHVGRHEPEMLQFVKEHRGELECRPTAFLSVTLSEAGAERSDTTPEEHSQFVADVQKSSTDSLPRRDGIQSTSSRLPVLCSIRTTISSSGL